MGWYTETMVFPAAGHRCRVGAGGFTLLQLLIVVAVIVILVTLSLALVGQVREGARRTVCASNLRQWGSAVMAHAADNKGFVPETVNPGWNNFQAPSVIRTLATAGHNPAVGQWSIQLMNGYLDDASSAQLITSSGYTLLGQSGFTGIWNCPSSSWSKKGVSYAGAVNSSLYRFAYLTFGWVNSWTTANGVAFSDPAHKAALTDQRLEANRLLMADANSFSKPVGAWDESLWFINHFRRGSRNEYENESAGTIGSLWMPSAAQVAARNADKTPKITQRWGGMNQLWGDGRVEWKAAERFPLAAMGAIPGTAKPTVTGTASRFSWYYFPWETFTWLGPND